MFGLLASVTPLRNYYSGVQQVMIEVITLFSGVSVIALFLVGKKGRNTASEHE
jgi:hypothetical protein